MNEEDVEAASEKLRSKRLLSRQRKEQGLRKRHKKYNIKRRDKRTTTATKSTLGNTVAASLPDEVNSGSSSGGVSRRTSIGREEDVVADEDQEANNDDHNEVGIEPEIYCREVGGGQEDPWRTRKLNYDANRRCDNCRRRCFTADAESPYYFDMFMVFSHNVAPVKSPLRKIKAHRSRETAVGVTATHQGETDRYSLCMECCGFLTKVSESATPEESRRLNKSRHQWSKLWPSFYWDLLVGYDSDSGVPFREVYSPSHLWRYVPKSIRPYWLHEEVFDEGGHFYGCSESHPSPFFRDRTIDLGEFVDNIKSYTCRGFLNAMDPARLGNPDDKQFLIPDVLCPWGCGEYCHCASTVDPSLLIQRHLLKVQLNLSTFNGHDKLYLVETSRLDYIRKDKEQVDCVLLNRDWKVLPSMVLVPGKGLCVLYCRHHASTASQRRLYTHPPKKVDHILSSTRSDVLCHCVNRPRSVSTVKAHAYNSSMTANIFTSGYAGSDSADIRLFQGGSWTPCITLFNHELLHYWCRRDTRDLVEANVGRGKISPDLRQQWHDESRRRYEGKEDMLSLARRGATCVGTYNALKLQQHCTEDSKIPCTVRQRQSSGAEECVVDALLERSWCPVINNLLTEDLEGYGSIIKGIKPYMGRNGHATMMLWTVVGMVSACNLLHYAIDQKSIGHHYDNFSGYLLAHINAHYMKHRDSSCPRKSPFNGRKSSSFLLTKFENALPPYMRTVLSEDTDECFFRFNLDYMQRLFPESHYQNIRVCSEFDEIQNDDTGRFTGNEDVFITVGKQRPEGESHFHLGQTKYEARVVIAIETESGEISPEALTPNHYRGTRYARNGDGSPLWWVQRRSRKKISKQMMKQHVQGNLTCGAGIKDPYPDLPRSCFYYVCVFVKVTQPEAEDYRLDMFRSVGAQCTVFCDCMISNPLIVSGRKKGSSRRCIMEGCSSREKYCCSNFGCRTRICEGCFNIMCRDGDSDSVTLHPPLAEDDEEQEAAGGDEDDVRDGDGLNEDEGGEGEFEEDDDGDDVNEDCLDSDEYSDVDESVDLEDDISVSDEWEQDDRDNPDGESEMEMDSSQSGEDSHYNHSDNENDLTDTDVRVEVGEQADPYEDYVTYAEDNVMDEVRGPGIDGDGDNGRVPRTNAAAMPVEMIPKEEEESPESFYSAPLHVLFNQLGSLCTRFNRRIRGTQFQQHFVQSIVSCMRGFSFPLLYVSGMLFPKHFWSTSSTDPSAILGVMPISCYRKKNNADGFASLLQHSRMYATSASSSTSTDHNFASHLFDGLSNRAQSGGDSRDFRRLGFKVSASGENGIELGEGDDSRLHQSMDSKQAARNLAAASQYVGFDVFHTFTLNASEHPGVRHLYDWKQSKGWTKEIPGWSQLSEDQKDDVNQSFEMAYTCILNRNWLETRKLLLDFIIQSARTILGRKTIDAFFRDEYQESTANVCHIHGLMSLCRDDLNHEEFKAFVCSLQRNAICDLILTDEIDKYIEDGLLRDVADWEKYVETASKVLPHHCDNRCKRRVDTTGDDEKDLKCRKRNLVSGREDPQVDDFEVLPFEFNEECKQILAQCGFYEDAETAGDGFPNGRILLESLRPKRHVGKVTPSARCNISEVFPKYFAVTRSMQNSQVICDSNKVSSYVVKYIVKLDIGNRCIVWADQHTGAVVRCENQFVYNSKITSSAAQEEKKFQRSRAKKHFVGRYSPFSEIQHCILGYPQVFSTMTFEEIETLPSELRRTTKISLDRDGNLRRPYDAGAPDAQAVDGEVCEIRREVFGRNSWRNMSRNQVLLFNNGGRSLTRVYDKVSLFGLRPVELMRLFPVLPQYFRWFKIDDVPLDRDKISCGLQGDITESMWIDSLGRRVRLRRNALPEVRERLESRSTLDADLSGDELSELEDLKSHILQLIESGSPSSVFIAEDVDHRLPIPVLSSVTPRNPSDFLLHCMLMIGEVSTELDLRCAGSMKETLARAKLIPSDHLDDEEHLKQYSILLLKRVITEVFPYQALTMRGLQEYIIKCKRLFDSVLLEDAIPLSELPPCLLTDLLDEKEEKLTAAWKKIKEAQLNMIYSHISSPDRFPRKEDVMRATKTAPITWDPVAAMQIGTNQTPLSHEEQQVAIGYGKRAVDKYCRQVGVSSRTKNVLFHGMPGAGKTHVSLIGGVLYGISQGLRIMAAALMAFRSQCIGGVHLHKLFCLEVTKNSNIYRMAELAVEKLHRKSNIEMLHFLLTMDAIFLDEVGQLSSQQFMQLDMILRAVRCNNMPFGGVLILGTFDHAQLGAIEGTPFLLSSLIQTDFNLIQLRHSVRAHNDAALQEIQMISRTNPDQLVGNAQTERRFKQLVSQTFQFVDSMSDHRIGPYHQRMYAKRRYAAKAAEEYVSTSAANLTLRNVRHIVVRADDYQRTAHSNATFRAATDASLISALNKYLREPKTLLFYEGAMFESTVNGNGYSYSQVLYMRDVPSAEDVATFSDIILWAKPPTGTMNFVDMENGQIPTEEELLERNWTRVCVKVTRERLVKSNHLEGGRRQYGLKHIFSSTINKTMGSTIVGPVAIEMSEDCLPWEKGHIVVMISRTTLGSHIFIVGNREFAINKMWEIICRKNQWTDMSQAILTNLSINADRVRDPRAEPDTIHLRNIFPYRMCDIQLPTQVGSYVYFLVSIHHPTFTYVGETDRLGRRLNEHNSGSGSRATAPAMYLPYHLAAYMITPNLDKAQRMSIEGRWQRRNADARRQGNGDVGNLVDIGRNIAADFNRNAFPDEHIRFVSHITTV